MNHQVQPYSCCFYSRVLHSLGSRWRFHKINDVTLNFPILTNNFKKKYSRRVWNFYIFPDF
jgi:hypothetical protein